jgi:hypothetical protein
MCAYQMGDSQLFIDSLPANARRFSLLLYARLRMMQLLLAWKVPKGEEYS